jgi:putative transposase
VFGLVSPMTAQAAGAEEPEKAGSASKNAAGTTIMARRERAPTLVQTGMQDYKRGSHAVWDCKYHLVWVTKYRYPILPRGVGQRARELLREIARSHEMAIHAGAINRDHVHMRLSVPPRLSVLRAVQFLKGKSSRKLLSEYQSLRERYWGQHLWARGYWVASSGNVTDEVWMKYIEDQKPDERDDLTRHRLHRQTGRDVVLLCSSSHEQQGP